MDTNTSVLNNDSVLNKDSNRAIINLLLKRMNLGIDRYGHGLRLDDDTRQWGTEEDSWEEMALEEVLDGLVYAAAAILRLRERRRNTKKK